MGAAAVAVAAAVVCPATSASAAPSGRIVQINSVPGAVDLVFQATELKAGQSIDPASVRVSIDGTEVKSTAKPIGVGQKPVTRTAVLVMDVSGSMKGAGIIGAKRAARAFVDSVPSDVNVGLVTFGNTADVAVLPTKDRASLRAAISRLKAGGNTRLYDGTVLGVTTAGTTGPRNVLVLSDGADKRSSRTLASAVEQVKASKVSLDAVSFRGTDTGQGRALQQLADAGGGRVIPTGQADKLAAAFTDAARVIVNQLQVTAAAPAGRTAKSGNVTVTGRAGAQTLSDTAFITLSAARKPVGPKPQFGPVPVRADGPATLVPQSALPMALGALFLGALILLALVLTSADRSADRQGRVRRRLSIYTLAGRQPDEEKEDRTGRQERHAATALGSSPMARSAVEFAGKVVQQRGFEAALGQRLEAAGVPLRVAEWMLVHIGVAIGFAFLLGLLSGGAVLATALGLALGLALPWVYLTMKESRRTSAFMGQLPDTLQLIAGSLSAGFSMPQAMETVVREGQQPITGEFNRALVEARLGVPIEDALDGVAERMQSKDFGWVVMAVRIQREVGGNLAEVLSTVAATLRERERLRRQVKVLSAEGRLSAWILGLLPLLFTLYLMITRPTYLHPLFSTAMGGMFLGTGVVLLVVGVLWLRKAVTVEV